MLLTSLFVVLAFVLFAVLVWSSRIRSSMIMATLAVLFMPFGLLVGIGYFIPKAMKSARASLRIKTSIS